MSKRLLFQAVTSYVFGILFCLYENYFLPAGLGLLFLGVHYRRWSKQNIRQLLCYLMLWAASFSFGMQTAGKQLEYRNAYQEVMKDGQEALLQGVISRKEEKQEQYVLYLTDTILKIGNKIYHTNQILIYQDTDEYSIGTTLAVKGKIESFRQARNDGNFDEQQYYETLKTDCRFSVSEIIGCYGREDVIAEKLYQLRKKFKEIIAENMTDSYAGIVTVMVLGDKSLLPQETKEQYQKAGISHILVISGLHISMLGMGVFRLLRVFRCRKVTASLLAIGLLLGYGTMIGMGVSTVRALLMFSLGLLASIIGRTYDRLTALSAAVFVLLCQNPFLLEYSGFQLSVAAIVGVVLAGEHAENVKVSGMIQLVTLPLIAYNYFELPLWALPVNLLVLPLMSILLFLGVAGCLAGLWSAKLAHLLLLPNYLILEFYDKISGLSLKLPGANWVVGQPSVGQIILYYLLLLASLKLYHKFDKMKKSKIISPVHFGLTISMLLVILTYRGNGTPKIDVLDVGQGDAVCLQANRNTTFFIDGGSSNVKEVGKYRIEPYLKSNGIAAVTYWFVSHADTDHVSGLLELLASGYPIEHLVVSKAAVHNENWEQIITLAEEREIPVIELRAGDYIRIGEQEICCIFPADSFVSSDINACSMVLWYKAGDFSGIFTGDISSAEEQLLLETNYQSVIYYNAAHHGSNYSNSEEWLERLSPLISTISCSETNTYGHPGVDAVAHMSGVGGDIYMTKDTGQITIAIKEIYTEVSNYRNPLEIIRYPVVE